MPKIVSGKADISVVIPAYNAQKYLQLALNSIYAQTFSGDIEIVAVNDGSVDNTLDILNNQPHPVKVFNQSNKGVLAARKVGLEAASGAFLSVLDADDLYLPTKLEEQYNFLKNSSEIDVVFCMVEQFISPDVEKAKSTQIPVEYRVMKSINFQGALLRNSVLSKVPLLDYLDIRNGDFLEWFSRVKEEGIKYYCLDELLLLRRVHDTNTGILKKEEELSDYLKIIRAKLLRAKTNQ